MQRYMDPIKVEYYVSGFPDVGDPVGENYFIEAKLTAQALQVGTSETKDVVVWGMGVSSDPNEAFTKAFTNACKELQKLPKSSEVVKVKI